MPMSFTPEYKDFDAVQLAELIKNKQVSPLEVLESCIELVELYNPKINAVHHKLYDFAKDNLQKFSDGLFFGVPFLMKDLDSPIAGIPNSMGSKYLKDFKMPYDSILADRFLKSGLKVVGKSATPELGLMFTTESKAFGPTRNPWDLNITVGGSSGGAASAVASRIVPIAHASDGGGSIRVPAASCGLIGLKPSRGRISFSPSHGELWGGLATPGILSRSVRDTAYIYDNIFGSEIGDPYTLPYEKGSLIKALKFKKTLKIGFLAKVFLPVVLSEEVKNAVLYNAKLCSELGHKVEEMEINYEAMDLAKAFLILIACHTSQLLEELRVLKGKKYKNSELENTTRMLDYVGKSFSGYDYALARHTLQVISRRVVEQIESYDVILLPITSKPPPLIGSLRPKFTDEFLNSIVMNLKLGWIFRVPIIRDAILQKLAPENLCYSPDTLLQNATGQPAMNVPSYWTDKGIPLGTQFVSKIGDEATLISLASQIEEISSWKHRIPTF